jgi:hypothetical protein
MSNAETDFRRWFVDSLAPLRNNGDAGFIFVMVAFPLLERYLRNKSGTAEGESLGTDFFDLLGEVLPDIVNKRNDFWQCYRNGLLHQVAFPKAKPMWDKKNKARIWVDLPPSGISGHDERPVYFHQQWGAFILNPIAFFDHVTKTILDNFAVYEGQDPSTQYPRPQVYSPSTVQSDIVPTVLGLDVKKDPESGS